MTNVDALVIGGGQSGLAAARAARSQGLTPLILEAGSEPTGSWPSYYDSLTLFSPAGYSAMPNAPLPGDPQRYPTRDEVVSTCVTTPRASTSRSAPTRGSPRSPPTAAVISWSRPPRERR